MVAIVWQFAVKGGHDVEFEEFFGADGDWNVMNRQTRSFLGSSFLRDQAETSRYILVEYWSEMLVYEQHKTYRSDGIAALEKRRAELTDSVELIGVFSALDVPDRTGPTWSQRG
jgi:hypothetical protein